MNGRTLIGSSVLLAGAVQQISTGDFAQAAGANRLATISGNDETDITGTQTTTTGPDLVENIGQVRRSIAAIQQQIVASPVWLGSAQINVAQLMLDTLDIIQQLAAQTASHTHPSVSPPTNAAAINAVASSASDLNRKYSPVIAS